MERIKVNGFMRFKKIHIFVIHQRLEHTVVVHMMPVNDQIVTDRIQRTVTVDKWNTARVIFPVEIGMKVHFIVPFDIHDRIIDGRIRNLNPSGKIRIFFMKTGVSP